jgi:hypothetical protein
MKKRQVFFILSLVIAIAATAVSYATTSESTSIGITGDTSSASVSSTVTGGVYGVNPSWSPSANSTGSITAGDLYIVDLTDFTSGEDKRLTLYLNNPDKLSKAYSYLNMSIAVYKLSGDPLAWSVDPIDDTYLTLTNGYISFDLEGGYEYSISVDSGSYYCMTTTDVTLDPSFFAELR